MRILLFFLFALLPAITFGQDSSLKKDSLLNLIRSTPEEEKLTMYRTLYFRYMDEVSNQEMLDDLLAFSREYEKEAERQNNVEVQRNVKMNDLLVCVRMNSFDEMDRRIPETLEFMREHGYTEALHLVYKQMVLAYCRRAQFDKAFNELQTIYQQAKQQGDLEGAFYFEYLMGLAYMHQDRLEEAEKYYRRSIATGERMAKKPFPLVNVYSELCNMLQVTGRLDDFFQVAAQTEKLLENIRQQDEEKDLVIETTNLWTLYAFAYSMQEDYDQVEYYCNRIDSAISNLVTQGNTTYMRALVFESRGQYDKALESINRAIELDPTYLYARYKKIRILSKQEKAPLTWTEIERTVEYADSLRNASFNQQLDEIRTQYEVDKHIVEKEQARQHFLYALGGCMLLVITLGIWIYYNRVISRKNRVMVRQIQEMQGQQKRYEQEVGDLKQNNQSLKKLLMQTHTVDVEVPESRKDKLCGDIRKLLIEERLYLDPNLTREDFILRVGSNKTLFAEVFQSYFGMKFTDCINQFRLNEALELLSKTDFSVEEISERAGFGSANTFRRQFQNKYGMSPLNYRKLERN